MRVLVEAPSNLLVLTRRLREEGHELLQTSEVVNPTIKSAKRWVVEPTKLGFNETAEEGEYFFSRIFHEGKFDDQTILSFPIKGMMNGGLGKPIVTGSASRYLPSFIVSRLFEENAQLLAGLQGAEWSGFVTLEMFEGKVKDVWFGIPEPFLFNVIEGVKGPLLDWLRNPTRLMEYWSVALHLSRYPFPFENWARKIKVEGLGKHFLDWEDLEVNQSTSSFLGWATAWSRELIGAVHLAEEVCGRIELPSGYWKQYRTDAKRSVKDQLDKVRYFHQL